MAKKNNSTNSIKTTTIKNTNTNITDYFLIFSTNNKIVETTIENLPNSIQNRQLIQNNSLHYTLNAPISFSVQHLSILHTIPPQNQKRSNATQISLIHIFQLPYLYFQICYQSKNASTIQIRMK